MRPTDFAIYTYPDGQEAMLSHQQAIVEGFCVACGAWDPAHTCTRTGLCLACRRSLRREHQQALCDGDNDAF